MSNSPKLPGRDRSGTISLCMIVKDEAEGLETCLSTARPHVDQIVVVDTGSTDGTQEIAKRYADVYDEIVWPDSFAEARNHSLGFATCDYILILDGDEFLPDPMHWRKITRALSADDIAAIRIPVRNLLPEGQLIAADRMWQERIFRNDPLIRYEGRVHNQHYHGMVAYIEKTGHRVVQVAAEIIHTGYAHTSERMKEKYAVRQHLLEREYHDATDPVKKAYYGYQLGVVHYVMEDFTTVLDVMGALEFEHLERGNAFYMHLLAAQAAIKAGLPTRALIHCNGMLELDRSEPVAYQITGLALLHAHQFTDGLLMMLEALSMNGEVENSRFVLNNGEIMRTLSDICRGASLDRHADAFDSLRQDDPFDPAKAVGIIESLKLGLVQTQRAVA